MSTAGVYQMRPITGENDVFAIATRDYPTFRIIRNMHGLAAEQALTFGPKIEKFRHPVHPQPNSCFALRRNLTEGGKKTL
jgi:hypothetical protein